MSSNDMAYLWDASVTPPTGKFLSISYGHHELTSIHISLDGAVFLLAARNRLGASYITAWDLVRQEYVANPADLVRASYGLDFPLASSFTLTDFGWVLSPQGKKLFWLPKELRGGLVIFSNLLLGVKNQEIVLVDLSAYVHVNNL
ncbi:hypothetical protein FRB93_010927 [Tulasnella sp. JGI-2019a]|nr:hypothetical protein FRB93_010927 [Tulasnella sp. JGI-2019a]